MVKQKNKFKIKMLIIPIILVVTVVSIVAFFVINNDETKINKSYLNINAAAWTGWSEEQPKDHDYTFKISEGKVITISDYYSGFSDGSGYNFTIKDISDDSITVTLPDGIVGENNSGGINLIDKSSNVIITVPTNGDKIKACTQTMDAGLCFTFFYTK